MAGLLNLLGNTAGRAFKKYPIGAPVATGASLAALTGTLGNEESGWVGRNQGKVKDAFGFGLEPVPGAPLNGPGLVKVLAVCLSVVA